MRRFLLCAVIVGSVGCSGWRGETPPLDANMAPSFSMTPVDLSTGLAPSETLHVWLSGATRRSDDPLYAAALEGISLWTGTGSKVPVNVSGELVGYESTYQVNVTPKEALEPGWYELRMEGAEIAKLAHPHWVAPTSDGSLRARVRVGSAPFVKELSFCHKEQTSYVRLGFSEPMQVPTGVSLSNAITLLDSSTNAPLQCAALNPPYGAKFDPTIANGQWVLDCGALPAEVRVELTDQVVTESGVPVRAYQASGIGFSREAIVSALPEEENCHSWRLSVPLDPGVPPGDRRPKPRSHE